MIHILSWLHVAQTSQHIPHTCSHTGRLAITNLFYWCHLVISDSPPASVNPCYYGQLLLFQCALEGTDVTILCTVQGRSLNWVSSLFSTVPRISDTSGSYAELNNTVILRFVAENSDCIESSATFYKIQQLGPEIIVHSSPDTVTVNGASIYIIVLGTLLLESLVTNQIYSMRRLHSCTEGCSYWE